MKVPALVLILKRVRALNVQPTGLEGRHRDHNLVIAVHGGEVVPEEHRKGLVLLGSETLETLDLRHHDNLLGNRCTRHVLLYYRLTKLFSRECEDQMLRLPVPVGTFAYAGSTSV